LEGEKEDFWGKPPNCTESRTERAMIVYGAGKKGFPKCTGFRKRPFRPQAASSVKQSVLKKINYTEFRSDPGLLPFLFLSLFSF